MKTSDFDYYLPQELIAQTPLAKRDTSRLLVVDRVTGTLTDRHFYDITDYFNSGDCLVLNDSKVFPARIYGEKQPGSAKVEFLLHKQLDDKTWEVMARPGKRLRVGTNVKFSDELSAVVTDKGEDGLISVDFIYEGDIFDILNRIGKTPLPPYIKMQIDDPNRYQTVYAANVGSSAAPTAGFHFTTELLEALKEKGVKIAYVTLHVGLGTFLPVSAEDIGEHKMHTETYIINETTASMINETKINGGKVVCCGTTAVRTIESSACRHNGLVASECVQTDIFIYPGFEFKLTDMLITNFHLPKSTLVMLVSAFYNREGVMAAYKHAVEEKYRFFSFGDACLFI